MELKKAVENVGQVVHTFRGTVGGQPLCADEHSIVVESFSTMVREIIRLQEVEKQINQSKEAKKEIKEEIKEEVE